MLYVARMFTCGFHSQYLDAAALTCPTDSWKKKIKGLMLVKKCQIVFLFATLTCFDSTRRLLCSH